MVEHVRLRAGQQESVSIDNGCHGVGSQGSKCVGDVDVVSLSSIKDREWNVSSSVSLALEIVRCSECSSNSNLSGVGVRSSLVDGSVSPNSVSGNDEVVVRERISWESFKSKSEGLEVYCISGSESSFNVSSIGSE